ncbi:GDP-mannose transporter [Botrytis cinerea]
MSYKFASDMDSLCEAFGKLTIGDTFSNFSMLPEELQLLIWKEAIADPVVHDVTWKLFHEDEIEISKVLLGINWLSHNEAKKVYKRLTRPYDHVIFFNTQQDSVLFKDFFDLFMASLSTDKEIVNSIQCSARICEIRPPLVDIDRYLELHHGNRLPFPFCDVQTFIVQDLQCSRKHRLQDITERVLCKEGLRRYFVRQNRKDRRTMIPEIIIRVPQQGDELCFECRRLDEWLALDQPSRNEMAVNIIEGRMRRPTAKEEHIPRKTDDDEWLFEGQRKGEGSIFTCEEKGGESGKWIDVVAYGSFSALLALILKYAVSGQYWNLNFFLLALQSGTALAVIWLLKRGGYLTELAGLEFQKLKTWLPLAVLLLVSNYISYKALQCLSLPTYILLSTTTIFTVPYVDSILFGTPIPPFAFKSYLLIFSGIIISVIVENAHAEASYGDRRLEQTLEPQDPVMILFLGYIFMVIHLLLYSTYEAWKAKIVPNLKFGQWDIFLYNHMLIFIIASALSFIIEDFSDENMNDCFPSSIRTSTIWAIIYTCFGVFPVLFYSNAIVRKSSSSFHSIVEASSKMAIALLGMYMYSNLINMGSVSAIVIGCSGGILGAWLEGKQQQDAKGKRVLPV